MKPKKLNLPIYQSVIRHTRLQHIEISCFPDRHFWHRGYDKAIQRALKLAEECADARQFVSPDNLAALERWGQDARNTMRFSLRHNDSQVTFVLADRSRATLSKAWPKLADLSALRSLVAISAQLDELLRRRSL
jgi:hypothetical protein